MVPSTVLTRSGPISLNIARPVNTVQPRTAVNNAGPLKNVINNAYSTAKRTFNKITSANNSNFTKKSYNTLREQRVMLLGQKQFLVLLRETREMLLRPQHVGFGDQSTKAIHNKDLKDNECGFVKELKFNFFSVSQMCDKKNNVLFTDTECVVLSPDFKLTNERLVLKVPIKLIERRMNVHCKDTSTIVKAFRVFNSRTRIVEENMHVQFSENTPNITGSGPNWLFDIDELTKSINYKPVVAGNQSNGSADPPFSSIQRILLMLELQNHQKKQKKKERRRKRSDAEDQGNEDSELQVQKTKSKSEKNANVNNTNKINTVSPTDNTAGIEANVVDENIVYGCADDPNMPNLEDIIYSDDDEDIGAEDDLNNLDTFMPMHLIMVKIKAEVYVCQPLGFEDPDFPDRVYKVEKSLYRLHQALKAWDKNDILFVQVYVDDIIFGSTRKKMCTEFERMMTLRRVQMEFYVEAYISLASTPMETHKNLLKDEKGEDVDEHLNRSMIGSLMYLNSQELDIIYLKGQPKLGLWYPRDSPFEFGGIYLTLDIHEQV
ncbi:hypothetical protein Tco_0071843 [Tanacetum coccineum]